jgi:outer membrane protein TolC
VIRREGRFGRRCAHLRWVAVCLALLVAPVCHAQLTYSSAIRLAMENSSRVKAAQNDLEKAQAGLAVVKDIYVPSVVTTGGAGDSYGITLSVPTIFTVAAQSLVYSEQQRFYTRAAHQDLLAAGLALTEARDGVEEDATVTYMSLDEANRSASALGEQYNFAAKLVSIVQDRSQAGLDSPLELKKARRGAIQVKLAQMQMEDTITSLRAHLAELTGMTSDAIQIVPESIPAVPSLDSAENSSAPTYPDSPGILAAEANAEAKLERAQGDSRYTWRPLVTFGAQYGRVSPINDVSQFYNLHGNYNTANVGVQIQLPLLDKVRKAAAHVSLADASRARMDIGNFRSQLSEDRRKLEHSIPELALKAESADLDYGIAQDELNSTNIQLRAASSPAPLTPKEEQTAHIQERQKYLDSLDAKLQFAKAEVYFLRQTGQLGSWAQGIPVTAPAGKNGDESAATH